MTPITDESKPNARNVCYRILPAMPGWRLGETTPNANDAQWVHIVHEESGCELSVSYEAWPKPERWHVSVVWPRRPHGAFGEFMPRDSKGFSINVGLDKAPGTIAKDILRRLAPQAIREYAVQAARMQETLADENDAEAAAKRIANAIEGNSNSHRGDHYVYSHAFDDRRGRVAIKVSPGGKNEEPYVDVDFHSLTPDEAIAIMHVIQPTLGTTAVAAKRTKVCR